MRHTTLSSIRVLIPIFEILVQVCSTQIIIEFFFLGDWRVTRRGGGGLGPSLLDALEGRQSNPSPPPSFYP